MLLEHILENALIVPCGDGQPIQQNEEDVIEDSMNLGAEIDAARVAISEAIKNMVKDYKDKTVCGAVVEKAIWAGVVERFRNRLLKLREHLIEQEDAYAWKYPDEVTYDILPNAYTERHKIAGMPSRYYWDVFIDPNALKMHRAGV